MRKAVTVNTKEKKVEVAPQILQKDLDAGRNGEKILVPYQKISLKNKKLFCKALNVST